MFDSVCAAAASAEQALTGSMGINQKNTPHHNYKNINNGGDKMDLGLFRQTQQRPTRPNKGQNTRGKGKAPVSDAWKKDATCHFCGKKGHIKKDCYSFLRSQGRANTASSSSRP